VPTVIDSFYLLTLGSYRAFYILNWITRAIVEKRSDPIPDIFGVVQTAFYVDFAWVYWTRQRVKLRNGGVIDSDDLSRGWLLSRLLGGHTEAPDAEEATGTQGATAPNPRTSGRGKWGARGVSVSADDEEPNPWPQQKTGVVTRDSDPGVDELDDILDDDRDESR
jgi:ER lumen protein retaining receptor